MTTASEFRFLSIIILFSLALGFSFDANSQPFQNHFKGHNDCAKAKSEIAVLNAITNSRNYKILKTKLVLDFDVSNAYINGYVEYNMTFSISGDTLFFDLSDSLKVDSVFYNSANVSFTHKNDVVFWQIPPVLPPLNYTNIKIYYHGNPPRNAGTGYFVVDTMPGKTDSILWTLSEPYGSSKWWPCQDNLNQKSDTLECIFTVSKYSKSGKYNIAVSNGLLQKVDSSANKLTYYYQHNHPIVSYLVCAAVAPYSIFNEKIPLKNDTLFYQNFLFQTDTSMHLNAMTDFVFVMKLFEDKIYPYPFINEKYGHTRFLRGGGMEHQTNSFMANLNFGLLAHEMAHQWFGNEVTCATWQDIWLNEGFATWMTGLAYEYSFNGFWFNIWKAEQINRIISSSDGSVFVYDTSNVSRIFNNRLSYSKGAMVIRMLQLELGDKVFFDVLKDYLLQYKYSFATTSDFQKVAESKSGRNLSPFFNQWIMKEGFPSHEITWKTESQKLNLKIKQSTSHSSVAFFEMKIPLKVYNSTKTDSAILIIEYKQNNSTFSYNLPFMADSIVFDPDLWLIAGPTKFIKEQNLGIFLYPNPSKNEAVLEINSTTSEQVDIVIYNALGQKMKFISTQNNRTIPLDIQGYNNGVYFVIVSGDKWREVRKLTVNN